MGSTEEKSLLQSLCDQFLSMQYSGTSVSLKCWFDGNQKLRFYMTNGPCKNKSEPTTPSSPALKTCGGGGLSSTTLSRASNGSRPFPPSPEVAPYDPPAEPLNVSIIENDRNTCSKNEADTIPNIPTMNRFEILMTEDDPQLGKPVELLPKHTQTETQTRTKESQYVARCENWDRNCHNVDDLIPRLQMCKTCCEKLLPKTYAELDPFRPTDKMRKSYKKWLYMNNQIGPSWHY